MAQKNANADFDNFFTFDDQTKQTVIASIIGLIIADMIIFVGGFLVGQAVVGDFIYTILWAVIGGFVGGFLLSKLYYIIMDFISENLKFLMPLTNTFFKFLFVPVVIGSIIGLIFSLMAGGVIFALGAGLGGAVGGTIGGIIGGSLILVALISIAVQLIARFIYAKFMVSRVGQYYKDYK